VQLGISCKLFAFIDSRSRQFANEDTPTLDKIGKYADERRKQLLNAAYLIVVTCSQDIDLRLSQLSNEFAFIALIKC